MKCLTPKETSRWIREQGLVENLFVDAAPSNGGIRCDATMTYYGIECFLDVIFNQIMTEGDILIQATDWAPSREPREFIFGAVRHELGELRPLREAPSFLVPRAESLNAVAIFALMTSFRWKCYAYGTHDRITLYNYEGECFDFWTDSDAKRTQFRSILKNFELDEILPTPVE